MPKQDDSLCFTEETAIACCLTCTLAERMKTCKTGCKFSVGLVYRQLDMLAKATKPNESDKVRMDNLKTLILA